MLRGSTVLLVATFSLAGCEPRYVNTDCLLPILRTDEPIRTLVNVGDRADLRRWDICPAPTARTFEARRSYGTIKFELSGSPHRLFMVAKTDDGRTLDIRGEGIEINRNTSGSPLAEYSHRKTFSGNDLVLSQRPVPEVFAIEILGEDGQPRDTIQATYDTVLCSCAVPEGMGRPNDPPVR